MRFLPFAVDPQGTQDGEFELLADLSGLFDGFCTFAGAYQLEFFLHFCGVHLNECRHFLRVSLRNEGLVVVDVEQIKFLKGLELRFFKHLWIY